MAAKFIFGCDSDNFADDQGFQDCLDQLPSLKNEVLPIHEDKNGDVYMNSGCDSNFVSQRHWMMMCYSISIGHVHS